MSRDTALVTPRGCGSPGRGLLEASTAVHHTCAPNAPRNLGSISPCPRVSDNRKRPPQLLERADRPASTTNTQQRTRVTLPLRYYMYAWIAMHEYSTGTVYPCRAVVPVPVCTAVDIRTAVLDLVAPVPVGRYMH